MFENTRTKSKSKTLPGYDTEQESQAKVRLQAAGWLIPGDAFWDSDKKVFTMDKPEMKEDDEEAES